jgi:hypothetical protein
MVRAIVAVGRVAVPRQDDLHLEFCGAGHRRIKIIDLEPQQHAITMREAGVADRIMMVLYIPAVQLHDQLAA